jgi:DNA-binding response OmpR family regulator
LRQRANDFFDLINHSIFLVETDPCILEILTMALTDKGYKVTGTTNYQEALMLISSVKPKLAIIEYKIKGFEAKTLLKKIKEKDQEPILLAISCNADIDMSYKTNGFEGFIAKPFDLDELLNTIETHLDHHS